MGIRPRLRPQDFRFPLEHDEDLSYKGKIIFTASKYETKTLSNIIGFDDLLKTAVAPGQERSTLDELADDAEKLKNERELAAKGLQKTEQSPLPTRIGNKRKCRLYLPSTIQFQDQVSYSNIDLGILGASAATALGSGANAAQLARAVGGEIVSSFTDLQYAFSSLTTEAAQVAALRVARRLNTEVTGAIETETGIAINPNKRASLRGPEIRTFRFTFKLIPNSAEEAREVKRIIQFFREEMYPDNNDDYGVSTALRFPSTFNIDMYYDDKRVATKILPSFLTGVDVVHNASGMSFHSDGSPQETDISLQFTEQRALTKRDIIPEFNIDGEGY